jgi:hypothetical protein
MEMHAFGFRLWADDPQSQKRFPISQLDRLRLRALDPWAVLLFCVAALLWLPRVAVADEARLPPGKRPVEVAAGFFLSNLSGAAERSETFEADLYLIFRWHDPRLAFDGTEPQRFLEDAAVEQLKAIWWPQIEFINTGQPDIANRALEISPDGSVSYILAMTATFRSDLDLRRFPFDRETLEVRIQSFIWNRDQMVFVRAPAHIGFNPRSTYEELAVRRVSTEIEQRELPGWTTAERRLQRRPAWAAGAKDLLRVLLQAMNDQAERTVEHISGVLERTTDDIAQISTGYSKDGRELGVVDLTEATLNLNSVRRNSSPAVWNVNSRWAGPPDILALKSATKQKRNFRSWSTNLSMISLA